LRLFCDLQDFVIIRQMVTDDKENDNKIFLFFKYNTLLLYYIIVKKKIKKIINKFATFLRLLFFVTICRIFNVHYIVGDFCYYYFYNFHYKHIVKSKFQFSHFFSIRPNYFFDRFQKKKTIFSNSKNASKWGVPFFRCAPSTVTDVPLFLRDRQLDLSKERHNLSIRCIYFFLF